MSSKFLSASTGSSNLSNGSTPIYVSAVTISNLEASLPVKTNSVRELISAKLDIHDVNGLEEALSGSTVTNPLTTNLSIGTSDITGLFGGQTLKGLNTSVIAHSAVLDDHSYKLRNITSTTNNVLTTFTGQIECGSIKKTGGTNIQYLMADGTTLTQSANSGNSNFYLYNSGTSQNVTPANGYLTYNNAVQANATMIYINHLTRDAIDIEVFLKQINTLTEIYLQDQNLSENYIQYNVVGSPTITVGSKVAIPVLLRIGNGTGLTNFSDGHNVLVSFFSNALEVDTRLSIIDNKTLNLSSTNSTNNTSMVGSLSMTQTTAILDTELFSGTQNQLVSAVGGYSYGFKFTITQPISIIRQGIWLYHWLVTTPNVVIKFWADGNSVTPLFTSALSQTATWGTTSYLYGSFGATPLLLPIGTYRISLGYKTGMFYNGALTPPFTFASPITNVTSAYSTSADGAYPDILTTSGIVAGGFFWFDTPPYGSNINVSTLNGDAVVSQSSINTLNTKTQYITNTGTDTQFSSAIYTTGLVNALGSVTSSSGFMITGADNKSIMRANGTYYSRVRCFSPFGDPLAQSGLSNFNGGFYTIQSFYMPDTLTVSDLLLFRSITTSTTLSIAIYDTTNTRIAFSTLTSTLQTTLNFVFTPIVLPGNTYYYFAVYGIGSNMYAGTQPGLAIINNALHPNIQFIRCYFSGTSLPTTIPLSGSFNNSIMYPPFTLVGY